MSTYYKETTSWQPMATGPAFRTDWTVGRYFEGQLQLTDKVYGYKSLAQEYADELNYKENLVG